MKLNILKQVGIIPKINSFIINVLLRFFLLEGVHNKGEYRYLMGFGNYALKYQVWGCNITDGGGSIFRKGEIVFIQNGGIFVERFNDFYLIPEWICEEVSTKELIIKKK